jgi:hypothetical protein
VSGIFDIQTPSIRFKLRVSDSNSDFFLVHQSNASITSYYALLIYKYLSNSKQAPCKIRNATRSLSVKTVSVIYIHFASCCTQKDKTIYLLFNPLIIQCLFMTPKDSNRAFWPPIIVLPQSFMLCDHAT